MTGVWTQLKCPGDIISACSDRFCAEGGLPVDGAVWLRSLALRQREDRALRDIPLGTHLNGQFSLKDPNDTTPLPPGQPVGKPKTFDLLTSTRVFQGEGFADLKALQPGQSVLSNLTWATLYGPGRITDLWIDEASRTLATAQQLERHRNHLRERGLPGWVNAVDDESQIMTITFFGGIDPKLLGELKGESAELFAVPLSKQEISASGLRGAIAVSRESLMTYDPVNDRKGAAILDIRKTPLEPGSSGVPIEVKCDMLLEGFRARRIVRFYPVGWKVNALPREEQFFGRE